VTDNDLTIVILRDIQSRLSSLEETTRNGFALTDERLSMVERGVTFLAAQVNVMRRQIGVEDRKTNDEIRDLQLRVAKLEDLVKP
jgi:hypothetical protein